MAKDFNETINQVVDTAKGTAAKAGKKAGEVFEISKLKLKIYDVEGDIKSTYHQLGKLAADAYKGDKDIRDEIALHVAEIDAMNEKIADYKESIREIKKITKCTTCDKENPITSDFCSACGAKLD